MNLEVKHFGFISFFFRGNMILQKFVKGFKFLRPYPLKISNETLLQKYMIEEKNTYIKIYGHRRTLTIASIFYQLHCT